MGGGQSGGFRRAHSYRRFVEGAVEETANHT